MKNVEKFIMQTRSVPKTNIVFSGEPVESDGVQTVPSISVINLCTSVEQLQNRTAEYLSNVYLQDDDGDFERDSSGKPILRGFGPNHRTIVTSPTIAKPAEYIRKKILTIFFYRPNYKTVGAK